MPKALFEQARQLKTGYNYEWSITSCPTPTLYLRRRARNSDSERPRSTIRPQAILPYAISPSRTTAKKAAMPPFRPSSPDSTVNGPAPVRSTSNMQAGPSSGDGLGRYLNSVVHPVATPSDGVLQLHPGRPYIPSGSPQPQQPLPDVERPTLDKIQPPPSDDTQPPAEDFALLFDDLPPPTNGPQCAAGDRRPPVVGPSSPTANDLHPLVGDAAGDTQPPSTERPSATESSGVLELWLADGSPFTYDPDMCSDSSMEAGFFPSWMSQNDPDPLSFSGMSFQNPGIFANPILDSQLYPEPQEWFASLYGPPGPSIQAPEDLIPSFPIVPELPFSDTRVVASQSTLS
ncbi:hypothetical protein LXA43DRAFT_1104461 [Ganoderma leucocontextum]|nr:hypothetical protein LXA43DRAFT_1104461 [Ganoderma leucocontextum]